MQNIIDSAHEIALKHFKGKTFEFRALWKEVVKRNGINKDDEFKRLSSFYIDLMQDPRFVHVGDRRWRLRETMKHAEWEAISNSMFSTKEYFEEGYESFVPEKTVEEEDGPDLSNEDNASEVNITQTLLDTTTQDLNEDEEV